MPRFDSMTGEKYEQVNLWVHIEGAEPFVPHVALVSGLDKEAEKTAALIAAAPELFDALCLILSDNKLMNALSQEQAASVLMAIQKAKGE